MKIFSKTGEMIGSFGAVGTEEGRLYYPKKIAPFQNKPFSNPYGYIIVDRGGDNKTRLQFFSLSGTCVRQICEFSSKYFFDLFEGQFYSAFDGWNFLPSRNNCFRSNEDFFSVVPFIDYVTAITVNDKLQLVLFDSKNTFFVLNIDREVAQVCLLRYR